MCVLLVVANVASGLKQRWGLQGSGKFTYFLPRSPRVFHLQSSRSSTQTDIRVCDKTRGNWSDFMQLPVESQNISFCSHMHNSPWPLKTRWGVDFSAHMWKLSVYSLLYTCKCLPLGAKLAVLCWRSAQLGVSAARLRTLRQTVPRCCSCSSSFSTVIIPQMI